MHRGRVVMFDLERQLVDELSLAIAAAELEAQVVTSRPELGEAPPGELLLLSTEAARALPPPGPGDPPRWVIGDPADAAQVAGAAVSCRAAGVLLRPVAPGWVAALVGRSDSGTGAALLRATRLMAVSFLDDSESAAPLAGVAEAFAADDCMLWWRHGGAMVHRAARSAVDRDYEASVMVAARVATATGLVVSTPTLAGPRSVIATTLRNSRGEVAGMIAVVADRARRFGPDESTDLATVSSRFARELTHLASHQRLVHESEQLRADSLHDQLTATLTRSAFEQKLVHELAAARRRGEAMTLAFFNVVGMRQINDEHGHHAGDGVLAEVASRIRNAVRSTDLVGRFGGDEFALVLINAALDGGRAIVAQVLAAVIDTAVAVDCLEVCVAVRVAVTAVDPDHTTGDAAFAWAQASLQAARPNSVEVVGLLQPTAGADPPMASSALGVGTTLGGSYRILHELSRGAMGVVYRAEDIGLGRPVAIKVLRSDLATDRALVDRFRAEAAILASLHHPNLVQVYTLGEHAGDIYFVMELVEGQPLTEVVSSFVARGQHVPLSATAQMAVEIADALDAMHQLNLIHRDVKPGNILLDRKRGRAVLVDVGIAIRPGQVSEGAGTPGFSAPESFTGIGEGPATDVYGLAATMYAVLTGHAPFGAGKVLAVVDRQLNERLPPPSTLRPALNHAVDEVLAKALHPDPRRRWASAAAFGVALASALHRIGDPDSALDFADPSVGRTPSTVVAATAAPADQAIAMVSQLLPHALPVRLALADPPSLDAVAADTDLGAVGGEVRGVHFRVAANVIGGRLGAVGLRAIAGSSPILERVLGAGHTTLGWEPVATLLDLLARSRPDFVAEELAQLIGRGAVQATFAQFFGANPRSVPIETVLRAGATIWNRYHTWSQLRVAEAAPGRAELVLVQEVALPVLCALAGAQVAQIASLAGADQVEAEHTRCLARGDDECRYLVRWSAATP